MRDLKSFPVFRRMACLHAASVAKASSRQATHCGVSLQKAWKSTTRKTVVVDGTRTPFCLSGTNYSSLLAVDLARAAIHGLLVKTAINPAHLDGVVLGTVIQEGKARSYSEMF